MCSQEQLATIVHRLAHEARSLFASSLTDVILFGSYALQEAEDDSDIDIMLLVDLSEEELNTFSDALSQLGFDYNVEHNIWFMPIVKNVDHFHYWCQAHPFYSNVSKEGISLYEAA